jgi:hypothetical protein
MYSHTYIHTHTHTHTAVSTLRGAPVVIVNPALNSFAHLPASLLQGGEGVRPMVLSDFVPCFQVCVCVCVCMYVCVCVCVCVC